MCEALAEEGERSKAPLLEDRKKIKTSFQINNNKKRTHNTNTKTENKSGGNHLDRMAFKQRLKPGEDTGKNIPDRSKSLDKDSKMWKKGVKFKKQSSYSSLEFQT